MKRFLFCIVMFFSMCMAMSAQGLKTYSGHIGQMLISCSAHKKQLIPIRMLKMALAFMKATLHILALPTLSFI